MRVVLIFFAIAFLFHSGSSFCMWGIVALSLSFLLDGVDGVIARKFSMDNNTGALIDTLGDRITENTLLIFFVYKNLIPLFIPLIFISRSFIADFIRCLAFQKGIGTFSLNTSWLGRCFVASKSSRTIYLILKFMLFLLGSFIITYPDLELCKFFLLKLVFYIAIVITLISILRFFVLVSDSWGILKEALRSC